MWASLSSLGLNDLKTAALTVGESFVSAVKAADEGADRGRRLEQHRALTLGQQDRKSVV